MFSEESKSAVEYRDFLISLQEGLSKSEFSLPVKLLVALSGGPDSTALLLGLLELIGSDDVDLDLEVAHFDHQLRPDASDRDTKFCVDLCRKLGVRLHIGTGNVREHSEEASLSIEAAARELRYKFLASTLYETSSDAIVTGHTMDDQAETVLLAMTRGAGLRGISGMDYVTKRMDLKLDPGDQPVKIIRPMLGIRHSETVRFCELADISPVEDETNTDISFSRNRIRHRVIPELSELNSGVVSAIARLSELAREDWGFINRLASESLELISDMEGGSISKSALRGLDPTLQKRVIADAYERVAGTASDLDSVVLSSVTKGVATLDSGSIDMPNGIRMEIEHDRVRFRRGGLDPDCPYPEAIEEIQLAIPGKIEFVDGRSLSARRVSPCPNPSSLSRWQAVLDSATLDRQSLHVRSRYPGDRFHALGMESEMKLQDFMVNRHIPKRWRDRVPLVATESGICWVVGERIAEWARVSDVADEAILLEYSPSV